MTRTRDPRLAEINDICSWNAMRETERKFDSGKDGKNIYRIE